MVDIALRRECEMVVAAIHEALQEGHPPPGMRIRGKIGALAKAAERLGMPPTTANRRLAQAIDMGISVDWSLWRADLSRQSSQECTAESADWQARAQAAEEKVRLLERELRAARSEPTTLRDIAQALGIVAQHEISPPDWVLRPQQSSAPGIPIALWSDWHIGETVDPAQTYGASVFGEAVADGRVRQLVERTIYLAFRKVVQPEYPGIVVWLGGDLVSGWLHQELVATDWCSPPEAVVWCISRLRWAFEKLAEHFSRVVVVCSPGNHGRITAKPIAKRSATASYDHIIYATLCDDYKSHPNIRVYAAADGEALLQIAGVRVLCMHGHELGVRGGDGIIGALGPLMRGRMKVGRAQATLGRDFDVLIVGHFHRHVWLPADGVVVNGTLKGWDEYARVSRLPWAPASQLLFFVHSHWGPVMPWEVFLQPKPRRKPVEFLRFVEDGDDTQSATSG